MMNRLSFLSLCLAVNLLFVLSACEKDSLRDTINPNENTLVETRTPVCDVIINFQPLAAGTVVSSLSSGSGISGVAIAGSVAVSGKSFRVGADPTKNYAMVFDADNPTGGDTDLGQPGFQKVLIISEDLDSSDPDDEAQGGEITLNFSGFGSGAVNVSTFNTLDNEEAGSWKAYGVGNNLIAQGPIPSIPNATSQTINVNAGGVARFVVTFNGSGAFGNFCLVLDEEDDGCTYTQGRWQNTKKGPWPSPYNRDAVFFLSGQTWQQVLQTSVGGNAYYQLAHQYIAAALNVANGASTPIEVDNALAQAKALLETYTPAQIAALKGDDPLRKQFVSLAGLLDKYNRGVIGPGHCED